MRFCALPARLAGRSRLGGWPRAVTLSRRSATGPGRTLSALSPHGPPPPLPPADEQPPQPPQPPQKKPFLSLDARVWPIAASTLLMGTGVGVIFPVMPMFARDLGLSSSDFGLVVRFLVSKAARLTRQSRCL